MILESLERNEGRSPTFTEKSLRLSRGVVNGPLRFFRGGGKGGGAASPLGGKGGRTDEAFGTTFLSSACFEEKKFIRQLSHFMTYWSSHTFLACVIRFGCR